MIDFHAIVNYTQIGSPLHAYIDVKLQPGTTAQNFEALAIKVPGVITVAIVTGESDFRVRLRVKTRPT